MNNDLLLRIQAAAKPDAIDFTWDAIYSIGIYTFDDLSEAIRTGTGIRPGPEVAWLLDGCRHPLGFDMVIGVVLEGSRVKICSLWADD